MNNYLLSIKEFDVVTCNSEYKNDKHYKYMDELHFKEFDKFVRGFTTEEDSAEALDFFRAYTKKGVGDVIQAKNYVGLVQLDSGYQIQILPKIDFIKDDESDSTTASQFIKMLRSMKDFPGKVFNTANLKADRMNLYEIFINMYIQQVTMLTKKGIKSAYIRVEDNLNFYKGKLLVSEHIKKNIAHQEKFYLSYDEFQVNRPENRLIKSTLLKLQKLSTNSPNVKAIRQLLCFFELVEPSDNYGQDFSKVIIDRNTKDYEAIIAWSKVFLKNKSFSSFSGDNKSRALLFPMEKVFEAYVAQNMKYAYEDFNWDVSAQDRGYYLFTEEDRNIFSLRPDIVITLPNRHKVILDTKWKRLIDDSDKNYGISQADMYQMFAYSKKYGTPDIWLLYPLTEEMNKGKKDIIFQSEDENGKVTVSIFFMNVTEIEESLNQLQEKIMNCQFNIINSCNS